MARRRSEDHHNHLALDFVSGSAARVAQQKQLIARLQRRGKSTKQAEEVLREFETTLLALKNHLELLQELTKPADSEKSRMPDDETLRL
jgi:hypothetical protein